MFQVFNILHKWLRWGEDDCINVQKKIEVANRLFAGRFAPPVITSDYVLWTCDLSLNNMAPFLDKVFSEFAGRKQYEKKLTRWFKVTFLSSSWRSHNLWKGHKTKQKHPQKGHYRRIARNTFSLGELHASGFVFEESPRVSQNCLWHN